MPLGLSEESLGAFDTLRKAYGVEIYGEKLNTVVRITGPTSAHIRMAIQEIHQTVRGMKKEEASGRKELLLQPPLSANSKLHGTVVFDEAGRPVLQPNTTGQVSIPAGFTMENHKDRIYCLFRNSACPSQVTDCEVRVRANFGFVRFRKPCDGPSEYNIPEFMDMTSQVPDLGVVGMNTR